MLGAEAPLTEEEGTLELELEFAPPEEEDDEEDGEEDGLFRLDSLEAPADAFVAGEELEAAAETLAEAAPPVISIFA